VIDQLERRLRANRTRLAPFVTAGDGGFETTLAVLAELDRRDVACVEIGFPFSDPIADGPALQAASRRALEGGARFQDVLALVERFRAESSLPLVAMGYANTFLRRGWRAAAERLARAGFDAWLVADLPVEEAGEMRTAALGAELAPIFFAAPTSSDERIARAAAASRGFLYAILRRGVTGRETDLDGESRELLIRVRRSAGALPVAAGFGLRNRAQVGAVLALADLAIVGSALVEHVHAELTRTRDRAAAAAGAGAFSAGLLQDPTP
jgi:tryptophan synthase alpha chain